MRVIAQVNDTRLAAYPNVPTLKEAGFDVPVVPQVRGIVAPPGISPAVVSYYEDVFARMVKTPEWKKYLDDNQFQDGFMRSAELSKFFDEFIVTMREILKETGAKVVR
jgi:putative tricarboxylic transport membrane protein